MDRTPHLSRILLLAGLCSLASGTAHAQAPGLGWVATFGGASVDNAVGLAVDLGGNAYAVGGFSDTADFDPGAGVFALTSAGNFDIYVAKLHPDGGLVWARRVGASGFDHANDVAVDGAGNVFVVGLFVGTVDFDPGPQEFNLTSSSGGGFVLALDPAGEFVWAGSFTGIISVNEARAVAVDADGNPHVVGYFSGPTDFDPGPAATLLTSTELNGFAVKLDASGGFEWVRGFSGETLNQVDDVAVDPLGNVYVAGVFVGTVDLDPGSQVVEVTSAGSHDALVVRLDNQGDFVWGGRMGGPAAFDEAFGVALDGSDGILVVGNFQDTADFDPGSGTLELTSAGERDVFVVRLDGAGNPEWARSVGGPGVDFASDAAVDGAGAVRVVGAFGDTVDFDPGPDVFALHAPFFDTYVLKLDDAGEFTWAVQAGGPMAFTTAQAAAVDSAGNAYAAGTFTETADFDPGPGSRDITSSGSLDAFVLKLVDEDDDDEGSDDDEGEDDDDDHDGGDGDHDDDTAEDLDRIGGSTPGHQHVAPDHPRGDGPGAASETGASRQRRGRRG